MQPSELGAVFQWLDGAICTICQDYLTDPVTIQCGHNFCWGCITQHCGRVDRLSCPRCGETFWKRPFRSNTQLGSIAEFIKQLGLKPGKRGREGHVCGEHGKELTWFCKEDAKALCEDCKGSPAHRSHAVIPMAKAAHGSKVGVFCWLIKSLQGPVSPPLWTDTSLLWVGLTPGSHVLLGLSDTLPAADPMSATLLCGVLLHSPALLSPFLSRGFLTHSLEFPTVHVTLDPDTAHPELILSEDRRGVRWGDTRQDLPNNPERFDRWRCVLGSPGFTTGSWYWEVEVGDEEFWAIGVARESVWRKGWISISPEEGIWAMNWWGWVSKVQPAPQSTLPQSSWHRQVRVCLDYEQGQVAFFSADNEAPIFTFTEASFAGERIRPFFQINSQLRLCP
uniref:Uncharacterized protein n=1 Tax=Terrapene triunguis TaxID=2587831 RepID=A0A674K7K3_9SAUR